MSDYLPFWSLGEDDANQAYDQVKSFCMSGFVGYPSKEFYGGEDVHKFEKEAAALYGYQHAISVNSWTSGLLLMLLALEEDGGEVIVTPWTMSATVMAIIQAGFKPVFADIDKDSFMPTRATILPKVTSQTKAILMADIFGQPFAFDELQDLRDKGVRLLSDAAQAHLATRQGRPVGWGADMTGVSFNRHKHVNTGEGGVILTNNERMAEYCRRIRNHGENLGYDNRQFKNMFGYNFRLTETQAAVGINQLKKLPSIVAKRRQTAAKAYEAFAGSKFFDAVRPLEGNEHSFFIFPVRLKPEFSGNGQRNKLVEAFNNAGDMPRLQAGYQNVHKLDVFHKTEATTARYQFLCHKPSCPMAEKLHENLFIGIMFCNYDFDIDNIEPYVRRMESVASQTLA